MITHLKLAKDRVKHLLEKYPITRDDDKKLWLAYLVQYHDLKNKMGEDAFNVFKSVLFSKNTCTMESVTRARRKIQEEHTHLAGKKPDRLEEAEKVKEMMTT